MSQEQIIKELRHAINNLCDFFYLKYYAEEGDTIYGDEWYIIGDMKNQGADIISIVDDFWNLTDIQTALMNDIDKDILFTWFSYQLEEHENDRTPINLWHFWLKSINRPLYTQEELEASEKAVKKAQKLFTDAITKHKDDRDFV